MADKNNIPQFVNSDSFMADKNYVKWLSDLKKRFRMAQLKAAVKVNTELLRLYWRMGSDICEKKKSATWGDGWLKELSRELMAEFPDMKGFSHRNLKYIRQWYEFYNQQLIIGQQLVAQLGNDERQQPIATINEDVFFSVPWGHHLYIISQCKDVGRAAFYLKKTVENGWSRAVLLNTLWKQQISQSASLNINCQSSCQKTYKASCLQSKTLKQRFLI